MWERRVIREELDADMDANLSRTSLSSVRPGPMSTKPYIAYLRAKYGELYQLPSVETSGRSAEEHT